MLGLGKHTKLSAIKVGAVTSTQTNANIQNVTFMGGAVTWTLNGWPASIYAEVQLSTARWCNAQNKVL
jgi:hypothetical protein